MKVQNLIIAIDGPAGSGKSTIAKLIAEKLGFLHIDTGAMYRAVTWTAVHQGIPIRTESENQIGEIAKGLNLTMKKEDGINRIFVSEKEITQEIREPAISNQVAIVAAMEGVRAAMVTLQQEMGRDGNVVLEGRDIGTVVYPQAQVKIFLTAQVKERAYRRYRELTAKGIECSLEDLEKDIAERDRWDMNRPISPLTKAKDAVEVDTTGLSIDEVAEKIMAVIEVKKSQPKPFERYVD